MGHKDVMSMLPWSPADRTNNSNHTRAKHRMYKCASHIQNVLRPAAAGLRPDWRSPDTQWGRYIVPLLTSSTIISLLPCMGVWRVLFSIWTCMSLAPSVVRLALPPRRQALSVLPGARRSILPSGRHSILPGGRRSILPSGRRSILPGGRCSVLPSGRRSILPGGRRSILPSGRCSSVLPGGRRSILPGGRRSILPGGRSPSQRGGASVHPVAGSICPPPESWDPTLLSPGGLGHLVACWFTLVANV